MRKLTRYDEDGTPAIVQYWSFNVYDRTVLMALFDGTILTPPAQELIDLQGVSRTWESYSDWGKGLLVSLWAINYLAARKATGPSTPAPAPNS